MPTPGGNSQVEREIEIECEITLSENESLVFESEM